MKNSKRLNDPKLHAINSHNGKYDIKFPSVSIDSCGLHKVLEEKHKISRPYGRKNYQIIYIKSGKAHFFVDGREIIAKEGNFILYHPKILMEYYRLEKEFDGSISLAGAEGGLGGIKGEAGAKIKKSAGLAEIIEAINEKYGTEFTEMDKVLEQIQNDFLADDNLVSFAKNNDEAMFGLKFEQEFENVAAQRYEQNDAFFVKMFQDSDVMKTVIEMLKPIIYRKMRKKK